MPEMNDPIFTVHDRVTGEEVTDLQALALKEPWAKYLIYCDIEGWAIQPDGTLMLLDETGQWAYVPEERYEVRWRRRDA